MYASSRDDSPVARAALVLVEGSENGSADDVDVLPFDAEALLARRPYW